MRNREGARKRLSARRRRINRWTPDFLRAWLARLAAARIGAWPSHVLTLAVIGGGIVYGAISAGHIALPDTGIAGQLERASAAAGLAIRKITVRGALNAQPDQIMSALGAVPGAPILGFEVARARGRLERLGWVASADVARLMPDTIRVTITERTPYALWQLRNRVRIIDKDGVALPRLRLRDHLDLPLVVGEGAGARVEALMRQLNRHPALRDRVRASVLVAGRRWNLRLDNGLDIKLPEDGLGPVLDELVRLDEIYQILSRRIVALDLRLPDRVTVRLPENLADRRQAAGTKRGVGE